MSSSHTERFQLHEISPTPPNLMHRAVLGFIQEPITAQKPNKVIIMTEIDIVPAGGNLHAKVGKAYKREVLYITQRSTRMEFLRDVGLAPYCRGKHDCSVIMQGMEWSYDDDTTWTHANGAYRLIHAMHPDGQTPFNDLWARAQAGLPLPDRVCPHFSREDSRQRDSRERSHESSHEENSLMTLGRTNTRSHAQGTRDKPSEEEEEITNLMMEPRQHIKRGYRDAQVFRKGDEGPVFVQTSEIDHDRIMQHIEHKLCSSTQERKFQSSRFHEVHPKPEDLMNVGSLVLIQEPRSEIRRGQVIILLDYVILQEATGPTVTVGKEEWRETKYIREITTRREWLQEVGMSNFCPESYDRCLVTMAGRAWKGQDTSKWTHTNGAYARIIAPQPSQRIPFHQFWQCTQSGMTTGDAWLQAQIQFEQQLQQMNVQATTQQGSTREGQSRNNNQQQDEKENQDSTSHNATSSSYSGLDEAAEEPQTEEEDQEYGVMLQTRKNKTGTNNHSFAAHARARLPPPGNGHKKGKKVTFSCKVQVQNYEGKQETENDLCITNEFIRGTYNALNGVSENDFLTGYTKGMRRGQKEKANDHKDPNPDADLRWLPIHENDNPDRGSSQQGREVQQKGKKDNCQNLRERQELYRELQDLMKDFQEDPLARYSLANNWDDIPDLHPAAKQALQSQRLYPMGTPTHIHIYVDGSTVKGQGAWAYAVALETTQGEHPMLHFVGYATGKLHVDESSIYHLGEKHQDSTEAESTGLLWAQLWVLAWEPFLALPITIHGDCAAMVHAARRPLEAAKTS